MAILEDVVVEVGQLGQWIQALGLIVIIWIIIQIVTMYFNRKRRKLLEQIDRRTKEIEKKVDELSKKK